MFLSKLFKKINMKKIVFISVIAIFLASCTKQLNQLPITAKNTATFPGSQSELEEYITSAYGTLQSQGLYGLYLPAVGEVSSDNTYEEVPGNDLGIYYELDAFKVSTPNGLLASVWQASYQCIQQTNVVLNRIDNINYDVAATKKARKGEMKFIRALLYFNLVRLFGDVPLVTTETTNPNLYFGQGRTASASVYTQIKADLTDAIGLLPATISQPGRVRKTAAQALLGKVYLTLKDYTNGETQLQAVIASGIHSLQSNPSIVFPIPNENNADIIFAVQFAAGVNGNTEGSIMAQQFSPSGTIANSKGHDLPTQSLYNLYTITDLRKEVYVKKTAAGTPFCAKWTNNTAVPADGGSDFPVLRYADVILMAAEAENGLNNTPGAITLLNQIRTRAGVPATTATTQSTVRDAIDLERRLELVGEGHRWFDLLRTGTAITVMNQFFVNTGSPITIGANNLLMPVPQNQIDTDPSIKQNPGY
jgi:hypothetical protein